MAAVQPPWDDIDVLVRGAPLLKFGRTGTAHFREFQLSADLKSLSYVTSKAGAGDGVVRLELLGCTLALGQTTDVFARQLRPDLQHVSFSLLHDHAKRSLDVACKDAAEYGAWVRALAYLVKCEPPRALAEEEWRRRGWATLVQLGAAPTGANARIAASLKSRMNESADVFAWGRGGWGELGQGEEGVRTTPCLVGPLLGKAVVALACGAAHALALGGGGELYAWGAGGSGRLGTGGAGHELSPRAVPAPVRFRAVAAGDMHSLAADVEGGAWAWGCGARGQLGRGAGAGDALAPARVRLAVAAAAGGGLRVAPTPRIDTVAAGGGFSLFLGACGRLFACGVGGAPLGSGAAGVAASLRCGSGGGEQPGLDTDPAVGAEDAAAAARALAAFAAGGEGGACLPLPLQVAWIAGDTEGAPLAPAPPFAAVAAGESHALVAARGGGGAFAWGRGTCGALGFGDLSDSVLPRRVKGLPACVLAVAAGGGHSLAIAAEGSGGGGGGDEQQQQRAVFAWGAASRGQVPWRAAAAAGAGSGEGAAASGGGSGSSSGSGGTQTAAAAAQQQQQQQPACFLLPFRVDLPLPPVALEKLEKGGGAGAANSSARAAANEIGGGIGAEGGGGASMGGAPVAPLAGGGGAPPPPPTPPPATPAAGAPRAALPFPRAISAGAFHCAVLASNGALYVWGCGGAGELGITARGLPAALKAAEKARRAAAALSEGREGGLTAISRVFSAFVGGAPARAATSLTIVSPARAASFSLGVAGGSVRGGGGGGGGGAPAARASVPSLPTSRPFFSGLSGGDSDTSRGGGGGEEGSGGSSGASARTWAPSPPAAYAPKPLAEDAGEYSDDESSTSSGGEEGPLGAAAVAAGGGVGVAPPGGAGATSHGAPAAALPAQRKPPPAPPTDPPHAAPFSLLLSLPPAARPPPPMELPDLRPRSLLPAARARMRAGGAAGEWGEEGEGAGEGEEDGDGDGDGGDSHARRGGGGSGGGGRGGGAPPAAFGIASRTAAADDSGTALTLLQPPPPSSKNAPLQSTVGVGALPVLALSSRAVRAVACGNGVTLAAVATTWMSDAEAVACVRCSQPFTLTRRRHHCRRCGGVFCAACSPHTVPLLALGHIAAVRVCASCYDRETGATRGDVRG